jgi:adenine phosphoribosyltransferase
MPATMTVEELRSTIREVPDFPKPGILFYDITTLLANPAALEAAVDLLAERVAARGAKGIVAIESRGFIFGAPVAMKLGIPLQLVRKPGKLPYETVSMSYELEYGTDTVEMHVDAIEKGVPYAIVDDLLATGGTAQATAELIERQGGSVACCAFLIELGFLRGIEKLGDRPVDTLIRYD